MLGQNHPMVCELAGENYFLSPMSLSDMANVDVSCFQTYGAGEHQQHQPLVEVNPENQIVVGAATDIEKVAAPRRGRPPGRPRKSGPEQKGEIILNITKLL
ncbi:uncharacterized protein LOC127749874 [Frankliniella occidentalis]|uniref:Uncharacterized protein LOC127749874 n=1 Tax=Frankliniella occidentalis TaxID=133901 RepID=A0A9C6WZD9_FRAOC|nr:uncharacterized protein LOC127749874 [Frankliniella occidentalis]